MLVINRKTDESLVIDVQGTPIYVYILGVSKGSGAGAVSLGLDAPRSWLILRSELPKFLQSGSA